MLVSEGEARSLNADRRLACALATIAGALNAAAFQAVGFFSANMTGNVSSLSTRLAVGDALMAGFYGLILLAFVAGAIASTLLINLGRRRESRAIYAYSILVEAALMGLLGGADVWLPSFLRSGLLVPGLSFLMGLQNAVVTRISAARVRTTHVSGMVTDIGIELGVLFDIARGQDKDTDPIASRTKLRLHIETVMAFLGGGIVGIIIYQHVGSWLLLGAASALLVIALLSIRRVWRLQEVAVES